MSVATAAPIAPASAQRTLGTLDVEAIRVSHEMHFAAVVKRHPVMPMFAENARIPDAREQRRDLMASSLRLSEAMAPEAYRLAQHAQRVLGITGTLELYQRSGPENAGMHGVEAPILLEIKGPLLSRLDPGALLALFGHELGHYLAHGPRSPHGLAGMIPIGRVDDDDLNIALSLFSMMRELTADRFSLLACQDLSALLRLQLVTVSGLSMGELAHDTEAYLAQCKALIEEDLASDAIAHGGTHPEHNLRVYAAWLFSETRTYRDLTGQGPGTRELADVDAIIARCFGAGRTPAHDPVQAADAPRELIECALAASVMVAHADGELGEDEHAVIEARFGGEIADWQAYLELPYALERFGDTVAVLAPYAHELGPTLLSMLFDIVMADGEATHAELAVLLDIGRILGIGRLFARGLAAMLGARGFELDLETLAPPAEPLPARRQDIDEALRAFLGGVVRRGETATSLRRMLRLVGVERRADDVVARLAGALAAQHITAAPALAEADLDARILLVPTAPVATKARTTTTPTTPAALLAALRRLREQLVSGDGRSPSVRLRAVRRGRAFDLAALERVSTGMAERVLTQVRARKGVRILDAADAGRHGPAATAATDLLALAREDAQCVEETGARDLYVGYPFLSGVVAGYIVRAPLVLYPVDLTRDGDGARGFRLEARRDDLPIANQSLIRLIFNKRGFAYTDELSDELEALAGDPDGGPEAVRRRLAEVGLTVAESTEALQPLGDLDDEKLLAGDDGLALEEIAVLGLFPQSSSDLLQDYDGLLQDLTRPGADVTGLLAAASTLLPDRLAANAPSPTAVDLGDWAPVIPADPSQRSVIGEARRHGATVVDGPPGTGKSQVIVNLVAEALRRGERVAVVCEKRAALDVVFQRMSAIGLGKTVAVVHDVYEDRKPLFAHIAGRLEAQGRVPSPAAEVAAARAAHTEITGALGARAAALHDRPAGLDLSVGELLTFVAQAAHAAPGEALPPLRATAGLAQLPQRALRELLDAAVALHPLRDLWSPTSRWRTLDASGARRSLATAPATIGRALDAALVGAAAAARDVEARLATLPAGVTVAEVEAARAALATAAASRTTRGDARDRAMFGAIAQLASTEPERLRETARAQQALRDAGTALVRYEHPVTLEGSPALTTALSVLTRWGGAWYRIFVLAWWQARGRLRAELTRIWPERAGEALTPALLEELKDKLAASRAWSVVSEVFTRLGLGHALPASAPQLAPTVERAAAMADRLRELGGSRTALLAASAWLPEGAPTDAALATWDATVDDRLALLAAHDALRAAVAELAPYFPWLPAAPTAPVLDELLAAWRRDGARLVEADGLRARATALLPQAPALLDAAATTWAEAPSTAWRAGLAAAWGMAWLARLEAERPVLARLGESADDREIERLATRLRELETERRELEIEHTLARVDQADLLQIEAAAKGARRTPAQKVREDLLKEARKQRMLMPLRTFVRRFAPAGLLDVAPVWLLSPETMAILFPRQPLFDLVVFDEASQCTVEAGLPVLLRARRVVIAGDEKQMPPSSYFALGGGGDDDDAPKADQPDEDREVVRDLLGAESLLSLARPRVHRAGLSWHYRCRDEALIAFSNHAMYQGDLLTIPSTAGTAAPSALHWVAVPDGAYNAGENVPEAQRVVEVVDELLGRTPRPTVGVVTFNLKQRKAVLDAVDARAATDPAFRERWADAMTGALDERPFVKNLEQVQGDERDVIVFSLGHAPQVRTRGGVATGDTYVPARFGPLGLRGGERRLNVAISRAKAACYIVASFEPDQLKVASSKHQGPRLFKHFLQFAHHQHHGRRLEATRVLDLVRGSGAGSSGHADGAARARATLEGFVPLKTQLALALEAAAIPHEVDVGVSGFRIPLAILDPAEPTRFALALLLHDGSTGTDPFELHVHRPGVLRQRGWNVLDISAASWLRRGPALLADIEALVPGCRGAAHGEVYQRHRATLLRPAGPTGITTPTAAPARRPRPPVGTPPAGVEVSTGEVAAPSSTRSSTPVPEQPAWALAIADQLFRAALLHLDRHGVLAEAELMSIVGGPRRARVFAGDLDALRAGLPFDVEATVVAGAKTYRKVPR